MGILTQAGESLMFLAITVAAYAAGTRIYRRSGNLALFHPVLIAIVAVIILLLVTGVPYERYFDRTVPLHSLLGPAIVALAVPLYENLRKAREALLVVFATLFTAGAFVVATAMVLGLIFRLDPAMELSLTTKSVTAPIALAVAGKIGGYVPLTILSVFCSGISGALLAPTILRWTGVRKPMVTGFTLGLTSHAFGIVRSMEFGSEAVAFATLGMALMGCTTAVLLPLIFRLLGRL